MGLTEHRKEIEEIDEEIIRLIGRRIDISELIFEAKRESGLPISDPERERLVRRKAISLAEKLDLDKEAVSEIFGILIKMSLQKQHALQDGLRGQPCQI